jgi:hypothetical protein
VFVAVGFSSGLLCVVMPGKPRNENMMRNQCCLFSSFHSFLILSRFSSRLWLVFLVFKKWECSRTGQKKHLALAVACDISPHSQPLSGSLSESPCGPCDIPVT